MKLSCRSKRALALSCLITVSHSAFAVEFYTDLIDAKDKENLDMSAFSEEGYIMPGMYVMNISLNGRIVTQADLRFYNRKINKKVAGDRGNSACITKELIPFLGLKDRIEDKLVYEDNNKCAKLDDLPGFTAKGELSDSTLYLMLPKKYLKSEGNKASNWENGIPGVLVDYNLALSSTQYYQRDNIQAARGYGTFGGNAGPWRLRADFHSAYENDYSEKLSFDWDRIYMYRAISQINGELEIGEDYLNSDIFSAFRFAGVSLQSDERMIPASLRGYAPEVRGIARTNALVTVRQSGRVVYETIVAAGPFTINELSSAVSGVLQVEVKEQDGEITFFEVDTATVPYLTRPGQFRFKTVTGRPLSRSRETYGPAFGLGEFSWGFSNNLSVYGGGAFAQGYQSLASGIGHDLKSFGAVAADVTFSNATIDNSDQKGKALRVNFSKRFSESDSEFSFAGYRFMDRNYYALEDFYEEKRNKKTKYFRGKQSFTVSGSKHFREKRASIYINWGRQTYWGKAASRNRYSISFSKYLDCMNIKNIGLNVSVISSQYNNRQDSYAYLGISLPVGDGTGSYSGTIDSGNMNNNVTYSEFEDDNRGYRLSGAFENGHDSQNLAQLSGYYYDNAGREDITMNGTWAEKRYTSLGGTINGGMTFTKEGLARHRSGGQGETRLLVSTEGVENVPVGRNTITNSQGIAVLTGVPSYHPYEAGIDVSRLPEDIEASSSHVSNVSLSHGSIGLRRFEVNQGRKLSAIITLDDGTHPPFGASVRNRQGRELGIISDNGAVWLSGLNTRDQPAVHWNEERQCLLSEVDIASQDTTTIRCLSMDKNYEG